MAKNRRAACADRSDLCVRSRVDDQMTGFRAAGAAPLNEEGRLRAVQNGDRPETSDGTIDFGMALFLNDQQ